MPLSDMLMLTAIVSAFTVFGLVLAWGDHRTRHLDRHHQERLEGASEVVTGSEERKRAA